jgi:hypothetical protein
MRGIGIWAVEMDVSQIPDIFAGPAESLFKNGFECAGAGGLAIAAKGFSSL